MADLWRRCASKVAKSRSRRPFEPIDDKTTTFDPASVMSDDAWVVVGQVSELTDQVLSGDVPLSPTSEPSLLPVQGHVEQSLLPVEGHVSSGADEETASVKEAPEPTEEDVVTLLAEEVVQEDEEKVEETEPEEATIPLFEEEEATVEETNLPVTLSLDALEDDVPETVGNAHESLQFVLRATGAIEGASDAIHQSMVAKPTGWEAVIFHDLVPEVPVLEETWEETPVEEEAQVAGSISEEASCPQVEVNVASGGPDPTSDKACSQPKSGKKGLRSRLRAVLKSKPSRR